MLDELIYTFDPYDNLPWREALHDMTEDGVNVISYLAALPLAWQPDGGFDFTMLDELEDEILTINPKAQLLPRAFLTTPDWWDCRHEDQLLRFDGPPPRVRTFAHSDQKLWKYEGKMYHSTRNASIASLIWQRDAGNAIAAYLHHLIERHGREHLAGIQLAYGTCGEWGLFGSYTNGQFANADFSVPMVTAYRAFLVEKYGNVSLFQMAMPPSKLTRMQVEYGMLRSPDFYRAVKDYYECQAQVQTAAIRHFSRQVKAIDRSLLVGCFGAGMLAAGASCYQLHQLPSAATGPKIMTIPELDFISTPNSYFNRLDGMFSQAPQRSVSLHKTFIAECDVRTHYAGDIYSPLPNNDLDQFLLEVGFNLATGSGRLWLYDFGKHWYRAPTIRNAIRSIAKYYPHLSHDIPAAEIALVIDPDSAFCSEGGCGFYRQLARFIYHELPRCGSPCDHLMMADVFTQPPYKLYIFGDKFLTSPEESYRLRSFLQEHQASAIWLGPAGCVQNHAVDFSGAAALTTFAVTPLTGAIGSNSITLTADYHPLKVGMELPLTPAGVEDSNGLYLPLLTVTNGEILGIIESVGMPGVAVNRTEQRFDLWSASPLLPARFLTNLCHAAGIASRIKGSASIYGAGRCLVIRADAEQPLVIYTNAVLRNLVSDSILQPENGIVTIAAKPGNTLLLLEE